MTTSDPATTAPAPRKRGLSLRTKLFLPLALLLVLLGTAALFGSLDMASSVFERTLDDRLSAGSEVLFRDFKKQEEVLLAYANFLEQFHYLANHFEQNDEIGILQDRLFSTMEKENISVTFLTFAAGSPSPFPSLSNLFEQVRRSRQPRFRYTDQLNGMPMLIVAAPLRSKGDADNQFLLLQVVMGDDFLAKACKPLGLSAALHDLNGKVLAASGPEASPMHLNPDQITELAKSGRLFEEHDSPKGKVRHLFTLVPLGSSDMILLSLESSAMELVTLQQTLAVRLILTIGVALLIGAFVYYRAVTVITRPARDLT